MQSPKTMTSMRKTKAAGNRNAPSKSGQRSAAGHRGGKTGYRQAFTRGRSY
jgi:hypothetical protein